MDFKTIDESVYGEEILSSLVQSHDSKDLRNRTRCLENLLSLILEMT
jgi:hypothetical protein